MYRRLTISIAMACFAIPVPGEASSEIDRDMAACAAVENSVDRLSCYDALATKRDVAAPKVDTERQGDWKVTSETSKIDDSTNVFLTVDSDNSFPDRLSREKRATFYVVCREKSTDMFVYMGGMFLSDISGFGEVTYRVDKNKAKKINLTVSTNNEALGLWRGSAVRFLKEVMNGRKLLLEVTPYNESSIAAEFNIAGMPEAIKPLRKACSW